jgi:predicted MFS family arabinose efflux permease
MRLTIQERLPFVCLALVAFLLPALGNRVALLCTFVILIWQGLGAGFTANPWQNLIMRIIPGDLRATFLGAQSAVANLFCALGAAISGFILEKIDAPVNFGICFLIAVAGMAISWIAIQQTREPASETPAEFLGNNLPFLDQIGKILRGNTVFRWFLVTRMLTQFASMAISFFMVYAVRDLDLTEGAVGLLTSLSFLTQVFANPITGWLSDRIGRKSVLSIGAVCAAAGSLLAVLSQNVAWFYLVIILSGIATTIFWTIGIVYSTEFGTENERPAYIGLSNTLVAPATFLAPILGGWLADEFGFSATFIAASIAGWITAAILIFFMKDQIKPDALEFSTGLTTGGSGRDGKNP